mmetsp:Transcript_41937/g.64200  ORF Transcript_41937/g.64200 Transcript_41937/m.64200 type:complete len:172 (+) Transcript_41937:912-1427(+)
MGSDSSKIGTSSESVMGPHRRSELYLLKDKSLATDSVIPTSSIESSSQIESTLQRHEAIKPMIFHQDSSTPPLTTSEITSSRLTSQRNNLFSDDSGQLHSSRSRPSGENINEYKTPHFQRKAANNRYASREGSSQKLNRDYDEEEPEEEGEDEMEEVIRSSSEEVPSSSPS